MNNLFSSLNTIQFGAISAGRLLAALITLAICLLVIRFAQRLVERGIHRLHVNPTLHGFVRSLSKILLYFLTVLIVADSLGIPVTSLVAVLGVVGVAISLAAQNTLANVAGGLMLLSAQPFAADDFIEAGGMIGTVLTVGLAYTKIRTPDGRIIFLPNNSLAGDRIINYTAEENRRVDISIHVAYENDPMLVKQALYDAAESVPGLVHELGLYVNAQEYGENGVAYSLRAWAPTADFAAVKDALTAAIQPTFAEYGVKLAYPRLVVKEEQLTMREW